METGRVYTTATFQGEQIENSLQSIEQRFLSFIRNFRINTDFIYRDQIERNIRLEKWFLEVDLQHLIAYDEYLADDLKNRPKELVKLFESAIAKSQNSEKRFQLMLISRANPVFLRDLGSQYVSKLVRVSGIVVSANTLRSKATSLVMTCKSCKHTKTVSVPSGVHGFQLPRQCEAEQLDQNVKCPLDPYIINHFKSLYADQQLLKIQEPPGLVPVGELPRHVLICTDRFLTNKVSPGMRVTLTGIFDTFSAASKGKGKGDAVALMTPYIHVFGIQLDPNAVGSVRTFTPQEEEEFLAISRRPNVYEEFISSLAPQIFGSSDIKKAMACLLFSGSKSFLPDGMKLRGDVNVLLLGDPGTAKSQLLKFVEKVAPIAVYTSGKGSSAAGLTASVIKDSQTREFRLEAGAMVLGDGGVVCIDEFDKMRDEDRVAIHEGIQM